MPSDVPERVYVPTYTTFRSVAWSVAGTIIGYPLTVTQGLAGAWELEQAGVSISCVGMRHMSANGEPTRRRATMSTKMIAYWTTTGLLVFFMLSGAAGELTQQWGTLETSTILGYPT